VLVFSLDENNKKNIKTAVKGAKLAL